MKKIFYILASAIVALGAVACDNQDLDNIAPEAGSETLSFTAAIDNTKTDLGGENGLQTVWVAGDVVTINGFEFVCGEDLTTFTCTGLTAEQVAELKGADELTAWYNEGGVDSSKGTAGAQLKGAGSFKKNAFTFTVQSAFLKFTTDAEIVLAGEGLFNNAKASYTGTDVYVAVNAGVTANLNFSVGGIVVKEKEIKTVAGKVYNLGDLKVEASEYNVVGSFQGWDVSAAGAIKMYQYKDWAVAKGVELYKNEEFKIVKGNSWDTSYGFSAVTILKDGEEKSNLVTNNSQNMKVAKNGKFDIYFNSTAKKIKVVCVDDYANLTVNITIDNKANWSPLYITLKHGNTTVVEKATVTNNKFAVSGNYIGETLSYTLSNGSKESKGNVDITKTGATITLEETIIKLKVQLNTDNAKQWWGSTMKIHVWETGTSFDTSWPGNTMTSEGNYTWSIVVPSELVGKTINYCVHNGNGWQSKDAKVTIKAEGNTVTGSSIDIN